MRFVKLYNKNWKKSMPNTRQAMTRNKYIIIFKLVINFGFISTNNDLKVKVKWLNHLGMDPSQFWIKLVIMFSR